MSKKEITSVVRLSTEATNSLNVMLEELLKEDKSLRINYSKLVSYILLDFHHRSFASFKQKLLLEYQDKAKHLKSKLKVLGSKELNAVIKYLDKFNQSPVINAEPIAKE